MSVSFPPAELMIVGDSLAQGCRSLTVKKEFCAQSTGARIARSQGWGFATPDFPIPILFDLEAEIRQLKTGMITVDHDHVRLQGFFDRIRHNLATWLADSQTSAHTAFDNLGLSGCLIDDLYTRTASTSTAELTLLAPKGALADLLTDLIQNRLGDLHIAINARFTLNPSRNPDLDNLTPIDWVTLRKPTRLIVQVGHNHGLYNIGMDAETAVPPIDAFTKAGGDGHAPYFDQWTELARRLAQLPPEVKSIVVCLLPKVGAVANLRPQDDERKKGYATGYEPVFSFSRNVLSGSQLMALDQAIESANHTIRQILHDAEAAAGASRRIHTLDLYQIFDARDYKNNLDHASVIQVNDVLTVDNRYVRSPSAVTIPYTGRISAGGFQSVDGMHPSGVGYADLAWEILRIFGLKTDRSILLTQAYKEDSLLEDCPAMLDIVVDLLRTTHGIEHWMGTAIPAPQVETDMVGVGQALRMMKQLFKA